jgi:hypothetical protein
MLKIRPTFNKVTLKAAFTVITGCTFLLTLPECSTLGDARRAEGQGVVKIYPASSNRTWDAALKTLKKLELDVATENKSTGYILAQRGLTLLSYGENVAIFVKKKGENSTEAEVVSKRVLAPNIFAPDWTNDIHAELAANLITK